MGKLNGRVAIITGASSGIGKHTAIRIAEEGAKVVICARREDKLLETVKACEERGKTEGGEAYAVVCDVMEYDQLKSFVEKAVERFGKIDILVCNALSSDPPAPFIEQSVETLRKIFYSKFVSAWHLMQMCYPYLKASGKGAVVNVCSTAGIMGLPTQAAYSCANEALRCLTRVAAQEWGGDNIRVNALNPAAVTEGLRELEKIDPEYCEMIYKKMADIAALNRTGDAYEDISPAILFLACDDSQFITGQTLNAEGGGVITS